MVIENMSNENLCGYLAYSLAGHDKGNLYVILSVEGDIAYLADGRLKLIDRPKKEKAQAFAGCEKRLPTSVDRV